MIIDDKIVPFHDQIKHIIFDWGGVISNIDYNKTVDEFKKLGLNNFDEIYTQLKQTPLFDLLEKGSISPIAFRSEVRKLLKSECTDEEIDTAWSAMLLDLPPDRLRILEKVRERYGIYLLSNTNAIHVGRYSKYLDTIYGHERFERLFKKVYYSHEVGMRKPDAEIFELVLKEQAINASETLFIDDTPQHIEGAKKVGIHTLHLVKPMTILNIFPNGKS